MTVERHLRFWLIGCAVFLVALYLLRGVLLPFVAGMAVAYLLDPVCDRLEAWGLSRTLATTVLTIFFLVAVAAAAVLLIPVLAGQVASLLERVPDLIEALRGQSARLLALVEARVDPAMIERIEGAVAGSADRLVAWGTEFLGQVISGGVALANLISLLVITPVVAFYLLRDWDRIVARVDTWLPREHAETIREQVREVDRTLAGFLRGQGTVCFILGLFYAIALSIAGLDFGLVVGLVAGLLSFIPYVGAIVGLVLSVGLAILQFDDWPRVAIVAGIFFVGQAVEGNFLTPKLVGESVGLHPVWIIFGLLAGGAIFGFVGVLLAIPAAAVIGVGVRFALGRYLQSPYYRGGGGNES
ncbi:MAG: AI-2E family transporter [Proteobacteria bacterium]|nr:AI-2E family transporter [Pseudomonadota bacterium]